MGSARKPARLSLLVVLALTLISCGGGGGGGGGDLAPQRGDLLAASPRGSSDAVSVGMLMSLGGITGTPLYNVECQQLAYRTPDPAGSLVEASALLCLPQKAGGASSPLLSYQHGTIFTDAEAPSYLGSGEYNVGVAAASLGYITVLPDYVGYGLSGASRHPYLHASTLASATVDAIRAARHYLSQHSVATNGKLFLTGYSEGGYATFAAQKVMEQELASEFPIVASVPGAGPYDLSGTAATVLSGATLGSAAYASFFVDAYDAIYDSPSRINELFRAPYAGVVATSFDGTKSLGQVEASLTNVTVNLFNEPFLSNFRGSGELLLKSKIAENDLHNSWIPLSKTRLFHGVGDEVVPYANATATQAHAAGHDVQVVDCNAGGLPTTHSNCVLPYLNYMIGFFGSLNPGL